MVSIGSDTLTNYTHKFKQKNSKIQPTVRSGKKIGRDKVKPIFLAKNTNVIAVTALLCGLHEQSPFLSENIV